MKIALLPEHRSHFKAHKELLLEEALTKEEAGALLTEVVDALEKKGEKKLRFMTKKEVYQAGRDLFRTSDLLGKWARQRRFSALFEDLLYTSPLRLGFDQVGVSLHGLDKQAVLKPSAAQRDADRIDSGQEEDLPCVWQDIFSVEPLLGVAVLTLEPSDESFVEKIFPVGSVFFARGDAPIPAAFFEEKRKGYFWIIGYTGTRAYYRPCQSDPNLHSLKRLGYGIGELLQDRLNPVLR